jgi:hypothetical protein
MDHLPVAAISISVSGAICCFVLGAYDLLCAKPVRERPLVAIRWRMRQYLTLLLVAFIGAPAIAGGVKAPNPKTILSCFEQQTLASICTKPCTTWAQSQPDFRYSLDICVANCRKQNSCVDR